jgi:iron complex outermembrane recepter protein
MIEFISWKGLYLSAAYSYAKHTYEDWLIRSEGVNEKGEKVSKIDYSGNEIPVAPHEIGNVRLDYAVPLLNGSRFGVEWVRLGNYWLDQANSLDADGNPRKYDGHNLFNLNVSVNIIESLQLFGRVTNLTDKRFAERATFNARRGEEFAPGMPRTIYAGLQYNWSRL